MLAGRAGPAARGAGASAASPPRAPPQWPARPAFWGLQVARESSGAPAARGAAPGRAPRPPRRPRAAAAAAAAAAGAAAGGPPPWPPPVAPCAARRGARPPCAVAAPLLGAPGAAAAAAAAASAGGAGARASGGGGAAASAAGAGAAAAAGALRWPLPLAPGAPRAGGGGGGATDARLLTRAICTAPRPRSLLRILETRGASLDGGHAACLVSACVRLRRALAAGEEGRRQQQQRQQEAEQEGLHSALAAAAEHPAVGQHVTAEGQQQQAGDAARRRRQGVRRQWEELSQLRAPVVALVSRRAAGMAPREAAAALHGLGLLGWGERRAVRQLLGAAQRVLAADAAARGVGPAAAAAVANEALGFEGGADGISSGPPPQQQEHGSSDALAPACLLRMLQGCVALRAAPGPEFMEAWACAFAARASGAAPEEVAAAFWALGRLRYRPSRRIVALLAARSEVQSGEVHGTGAFLQGPCTVPRQQPSRGATALTYRPPLFTRLQPPRSCCWTRRPAASSPRCGASLRWACGRCRRSKRASRPGCAPRSGACSRTSPASRRATWRRSSGQLGACGSGRRTRSCGTQRRRRRRRLKQRPAAAARWGRARRCRSCGASRA
jgi:hypothetical protein